MAFLRKALTNNICPSRIPLFDCACTLWLSKDKTELLVGYLKKPPQLWSILGVSHGVLTMCPSRVYQYLDRGDEFAETGLIWQRWSEVFFLWG